MFLIRDAYRGIGSETCSILQMHIEVLAVESIPITNAYGGIDSGKYSYYKCI